MPSEIAQSLAQVISNGLRRKSIVDCARWAEKCRIMGKPFPGPYSFKYFPWAKEMLNCDDRKWIGMKSAQVGFTDSALNRVLFTIDIKRVDCLYVLPAKTPDASDFSASRFDGALELSPYLQNLFSEVKNVGHKRAGSANLYIRGSRSTSGLKSIPAGLLVLDELDEMDQDNIGLATERQSGQVERQEIRISTPTTAGRGISLEFEDSTKEQWYFPCPHCSRIINLTFPESMVITASGLHDKRISDTHLICKICKGKLAHENKYDWLARGAWQPENSSSPFRGFHINQLYSSAQSPVEIAINFFKAQVSPSDEQTFYNSNLGVTHETKGSRVTDSEIYGCMKEYLLKPDIPSGRLVTMGCDPGTDIHYEIDEWKMIPDVNNIVDINLQHRPRLLDAGKVKNFEDLDLLMRKWQVRSCVVDANPEKRKALEFASRFDGRVHLCLYGEGVKGKNIQVWTNEPTITVDRTAWLDLSLGRIRTSGIALPRDISDEYKRHIKAPVRVPGKDQYGNPTARYVTGERVADHFAHTRNYAEIALTMVPSFASHQTTRSPR